MLSTFASPKSNCRHSQVYLQYSVVIQCVYCVRADIVTYVLTLYMYSGESMFHVGAIESPFGGEMYVHVSVMWGTRSFAAVV